MSTRMKKLLSLYRPYRWKYGVTLSSALLVAVISLFYPLCTRYIAQITLDQGVEEAVGRLLGTGVFMLVLVFAERILHSVYDYYGHCLGAVMENDLRFEVFAHLEHMPMTYYDQKKTGQLMSMLTNDLLSLSELLHHGPEDYIVYFMKFTGALVILFSIQWKLTLVIVPFLPLMAYLTLHFSKKEKEKAKINQQEIGNVNAQAEDTLAGIRDVKVYTMEKEQEMVFRKAGERFLKGRKSQYLTEAVTYQSIMLISRVIYVAVVLAGGAMVAGKTLELADLLAFLLYITYLTEPIEKLAWMTTQFQQGMAGFERVMEVLEQPSEQEEEKETVLEGNISFDNVSFQYENQEMDVFSGLNLKIQKGDFMGLIGVSGKGKSTISSLISQLYQPTAGKLLFDGKEAEEIGIRTLRKNIAIVHQENYLFDTSLYENIVMGKKGAKREEVEAACQAACIHSFIESLPEGYNTCAGSKGVRLSGGQKQRICIARALVKDAPILILDEGTSALDMETEEAVIQNLKKLRQGKTTILITHRLAALKELDYVVDLDKIIEK